MSKINPHSVKGCRSGRLYLPKSYSYEQLQFHSKIERDRKYEIVKCISFMRKEFRGIKNVTPSNSVYMDLQRSTFNSEGNDHMDARTIGFEDKETVVITNIGTEVADIKGWNLKDAVGHTFTFDPRSLIKPNGSFRVYVGMGPFGKGGWKEYYDDKLIAVLTNKGEFLKLVDKGKKVISYVYMESKTLNKHLDFIRP